MNKEKNSIKLICANQLLRFSVSRGSIIGHLSSHPDSEWAKDIDLKEEFNIQARDELQICAELENKHQFKLIAITKEQGYSGLFINEFYLRRQHIF